MLLYRNMINKIVLDTIKFELGRFSCTYIHLLVKLSAINGNNFSTIFLGQFYCERSFPGGSWTTNTNQSFFFFHKNLEVPLVNLIEGKHSTKQVDFYVVFFSKTAGSNCT